MRGADAPALSPREREAMARLADGMTNREIAVEMGVGVYRVRDLVKCARIKMGMPGASRVELANAWRDAR